MEEQNPMETSFKFIYFASIHYTYHNSCLRCYNDLFILRIWRYLSIYTCYFAPIDRFQR